MKKLFIFFILFGSICGCMSSSESILSADLLLLHEGSMWIYETVSYPDSGIATTVSDTFVSGRKLFFQGMEMTSFKEMGSEVFYSNQQHGLWKHDSLANKNILEFEYPTASGTEYVAAYDSIIDDTSKKTREIRVKVVSSSEEVVTDVGKFNCYHYREEIEIVTFTQNIFLQTIITNTQTAKEFYFAPGIGIVKIEIPKAFYTGYPSGIRQSTILKQYFLK